MRSFQIPKNPHDDRPLYETGKFIFKPGITILTGCNGCGKTTLLQHIRTELEKTETPFLWYDNLHDGQLSAEESMLRGDIETTAALFMSSEG